MRKMKDSGIEWVGNIPDSWSVDKTKYHFYNTKTIVGTFADNYERLALTMKGVVRRSKEDSNGLQPINFNSYQILKKDELVFKLIDLQNITTSRIGLSPFDGIVSPAYIVLHECGNIVPSFAEKYFIFLWKNEIFNFLGDCGVRSNLGAPDLLDIPIPFPSKKEQTDIARYLDTKCAEIDSLVTDIQSQIDTLEQYKRSVITEAVTKGLDPDAEMKDSGVEWIAEIPKKWEVKRNKFIATSLLKGNGITKEQVQDDGDTPCIRYGEIYAKYEYAFDKTLSRTNIKSIGNPQFAECGNILFAGTGELVEEIGKNIVYLGKEKCMVGGDIIIMRHSQNAKFLNYALGSDYAQAQKSGGKAKLKVVHISATDIGNLLIALPPLSEQQAIASFLDEKCANIDANIADRKQQLNILSEYKKSLIYEYVTGKKEVPSA